MTFTMKLILFFAVLAMDLVAGFLVVRKLKAEGKEQMILIILTAMFTSLVAIGIVLFIAI